MYFNSVDASLADVEIREDIENHVVKKTADNIISPVLISYVWWVLTRALKNGQKKLYFLARDGYIMHKIAEQFRERFNLDVECRCLYGSRLAWRTAAYNFIGDEKYKYIFSGGYLLTPRIILKRVLADSEQRQRIYSDINNGIHINSNCGYDLSNENQALNSKSMKIFAERLKKSRIFSEYLDYISEKQFHGASMYLRQEGVFDGNDIVIVDSGWTGSVQRTLRQIAERHVANPNITGYYFGLYAQSDDLRDGKYETWYFNRKSPVSVMTNFNNNVFEFMCVSPFKMTVGYEFSESSGVYIPVHSDSDSEQTSKEAIRLNRYIENFTSDFLNNSDINFDDYNDVYLEKSRKLLKRFMINPTKIEAEAFGQYKFCDDASDSYKNDLARIVDGNYLKQYSVIKRLFRKISKKTAGKNELPDLFWFHGSLAVSEIKNQKLHRFNYKLWEFSRILIKKYRLN